MSRKPMHPHGDRMSNGSFRSLVVRFAITIIISPSSFASLGWGQVAPPETYGEYGVGLNWFAAKLGDSPSIDTAVWYPISKGTEGDTLAYSMQGLPYESPFLDVVKDAEPIRDVPFPLVVLSHGYTGVPQLVAHLGEALASHGYVVAAPQHPRSTEEIWDATGRIDSRANELTLAVESMFARATTDNDIFHGIIDTEKLIVGGGSLGAFTAMASVQQNEYEPDGILLIDGFLGGSPLKVDVPVIHLGGGSAFASQAASQFVASDFYGVDLYGADPTSKIHHWSFFVNACQFRHKIVEAGATEAEALQATDQIEGLGRIVWFGCRPHLVEPGVVQQRVNEYALAFASDVFDVEDTFLSSVAQTGLSAGDLKLVVRVDTDSRQEGLSVLLTDPQGRMYGIDPETGELINDFGASGVLGRPHRIRPEIEFGIRESQLLSGEFTLSATADVLSEAANYEVVLQAELKYGDDRVVLKRLLGSGVVQPDTAISPVTFTLGNPPAMAQLLAGDADQDSDFDQFDLVNVQIGGKYLTGQAATWGQGDWDGAPGGMPGNPPAGNGLFDQRDVIAALGAGTYLTGPYAAVQPSGQLSDGQTSVIYDAGTGELAVDPPAGVELTSINIDSAAGIFTGIAAANLGGSFDNDADANIFKATFGGSFGSLSFGNVAQAGLSEEFVLSDLTVVGSLAGGGALGNVDLVYVPEPATLGMLTLGLLFSLRRFTRTVTLPLGRLGGSDAVAAGEGSKAIVRRVSPRRR